MEEVSTLSTEEMKQERERSEKRIKELEESIRLAEALENLHNNEDFKLVILDGYFEKEGKRLTGVLLEPSTLKRDVIQNIMDKVSAIRNLKQFFGVILQNAHMAPQQIDDEKKYIEELAESNSYTAKGGE